jgi:predicted AAA+ superfamily ATPase
VERDLRQILNVRDLVQFEVFLKLCAGRTGQLLNLSALGGDAGISHNTARQWLSILEASYVVRLLRPYYRNLGKRLVKDVVPGSTRAPAQPEAAGAARRARRPV